MLGSRRSRDVVTCIACGESVDRTDAREYDKHGDRWNRRDKEFEYLCKPCHRDLTHQPRSGLEDTLDDAGAGELDQARFLQQYHDLVRGRDSPK
ncbi:hypothetical protein SAMN05216559_2152 [Halomicrobium zhouii]|uniref:Small CPxCG-related zinc finger protein n=1 Tax=Halomicrobium zhouii TaxID=767519 RepID=A0A1I6L6J2_9EURY|nr:hypothetical protein [Halomicrobium zhouii]MCU4799957.1 hypothetical protein [Halobacteria archaeon HArc-gm2]SFR99086.1 hypothetical protein SAMN05216559_2152 [Halomicrobium zhouii]